MNWLTAAVLVVGFFVWYSKKTGPTKAPKKIPPERPNEVSADRIDAALASNEPKEMAAQLDKVSDPIDRHRLLTAMITQLYRDRAEKQTREKMYEYGDIYMGEFGKTASALKKSAEDGKMDVPVLKCIAIAMEEDRRYDEAIGICRQAIEWNIDDGTKSGYSGRIERLQKKQAAQ